MDNLKWVVYKHTNRVNRKVYIGITHNIHKRWRGNGCAYKSNPHFWQAIQKYGWDAFDHEIIHDNISHQDACAYEIELIEEHRACDRRHGYNNSHGGESPLVIHTGANHHFYGKHLSEEHRKKLSESHKGEKHFWYGKQLPEETRKKIGNANRGRTLSKEQKEHLRRINLGKRASDETKQKMSRSHRGHPVSAETRQRIRETKISKPILQLTTTGEVLCEWPSVAEAARGSGLDRSQIRKCCKGELKTSGGFKWKYLNHFEESIEHL